MAGPCLTCCDVYGVNVAIGKKVLTLKHDADLSIKVSVNPSNANVTAVRVEITRMFGGSDSWCTIGTELEFDWKARVSGYFNIRAYVTVCGVEYMSNYDDFEVQYPSYDEIVGDADVQRIMLLHWRQTLLYNTPDYSRELGTFIRLDTVRDRYKADATFVGPLARQGNYAGLHISEIPDPVDNPAPPTACSAGGDYYVASFHTHPPPTFARGLIRQLPSMPVGESEPDYWFNHDLEVPGIVYDMIPIQTPQGTQPRQVPFSTPEDAPAGPYRSGPHLRRHNPLLPDS